jgi:hypothetical protein
MKIALVFHGQPRFICKDTYESVKSFFLDKYNCDVYAHFWFSGDSSTEYETSPWSTLGSVRFPSDTIDIFKAFYKPVAVRTDPPLQDDISLSQKYSRSHHPRAAYNLLSAYLSRKLSFQIIQNPNQYDFIIWLRSDTVYVKMPDLLSLDTSYIYRVVQVEEPTTFYNDAFVILPPLYAEKIFCIYDIIDILYQNGCFFNSENIFSASFDYYNLNSVSKTFNKYNFNMGFMRNNNRIAYCLSS